MVLCMCHDYWDRAQKICYRGIIMEKKRIPFDSIEDHMVN